MSTQIKAGSSGKNFIPPKPGSYVARCIGLIAIGTTDVAYKNEIQKKNLIRFRYELPTKLEEFKEGEGKKPWVVELEFTNTTNSKGNLFKWLTNWSPKITKDNIDKLDLAKVIGQPCLLTIAHNPSKTDPDRIYLKATGITSLPEGMKIPDQINETFLFDVDDFDQEKFNTLPQFIREKITRSEEFKKLGLKESEVESLAKKSRGQDDDVVAEEIEDDQEDKKNEVIGKKVKSDEQFF